MQARTRTGASAQAFIAAALTGCALSFIAGFAAAQVPAGAERDADEQRRALERETRLRERQERTPDVRLPTPAAAPPQRLPTAQAPCFTLREIELRGDASNHFGWLTGALAGPERNDNPLGKCLGTQGINILLERAQDALIAKGFVTSRVLAEPQDLSTGRLVLTLIPGRIRAIRFVEPVDPRGTAWNAVPAKAGDLLNLRDIEQALENFKRVPSAEADVQIAPATGDVTQPGQSDVLIRYRQGSPLRLALSADDSGTRSTGRYQGGITLSYDNGWTLNDLFYVSLNHDLGHNLGSSDADPRGTQGATVHYSVPLGYWLLGATVSSYRYFQTVAGASQDYIFSGTSRNAEVKLSRLLYRDASGRTTASIKAFQRRSNNFIDDTEVQVQRRAVGGWELGIGHRQFIGAAVLEGSLAYKRGTGAFGSLAASEEAFGEGSSRFALVSADAALSLPFKLGNQRWRYSANGRAQFDRTPLTPQDRFAIGGRYSVRGFDGEEVLSAERGWLIRNELGAPLGDGGQEVYVGLDHGQVGGPSSAWLSGRRLTGAVLGLRGGIRNLQYDLFIGAPVRKPAGLHTAGSVAGFSLNLSF